MSKTQKYFHQIPFKMPWKQEKKMDYKKALEKIYELIKDTEELNPNNFDTAMALHNDEVLTQILRLCEEYLSD